MVRGGSRGRQKSSIQSLSRVHASVSESADELEYANDRATALIVGATLSQRLKQAIERYLVVKNATELGRLFYEAQAPLGAFASRILMASALGFLRPAERRNLDTFRRIRNAFAHTAQTIQFDTPEVNAECEKLTLMPLGGFPDITAASSARDRFINAFYRLDIVIFERLTDIAVDKALQLSQPPLLSSLSKSGSPRRRRPQNHD